MIPQPAFRDLYQRGMRDAECPHPASRILDAPTTVHHCTVIAGIVTNADAAETRRACISPAVPDSLGTAVLYNKSIANKGAGCGMRRQSPQPAHLTLCIYDSAIRGAISDCTVHTLSSAPLMTRLSQG